ncbi:MAG: M16 family metallopeptidase, partial [Pseudomonas sp.]
MFDLQVVFDAGSGRDDGATGLAQLTLSMLQEGTRQRDAQQIAEGFDAVGARLATSVRRNKATLRIRSLSAEQQRNTAVALLAEMLGQPLFAEDKLQQVKDQLINVAAQRQESAFEKAVDQLFKHAYANHPYAANDARIAHTIPELTPAVLKAFHQNALNARNALITLVGDLSVEHAREIAVQISAALPAGQALPPLQPPSAFESEIYHLEHPGTQSNLLLAIPGIDIDHPDAPALALANLILGGPGATSRLFEALRTQRGLTYS